MSKTKTVRIRAIYADTDAMGIVYHTNYIRWFEIGRNELFRDIGIPYTEVEAAGFCLPLTQVYCHYLRPTKYDDLVELETDIAYLRRASIKFSYLVRLTDQPLPVVTGYSVHACTDRNGQIVRIPTMVTDRIQNYYSH